MALFDAILNLVAFLLWLNWRAHDQFPEAGRGVTVLANLQRPRERSAKRWVSLGLMFVLLVLRGLAGWHLGSVFDWTPAVDLGVVALPFYSSFPARMLLHSFFSFAELLLVFHFWLLLVSALRSGELAADPVLKLVRHLLGRAENLPRAVKFFLPFAASSLGWLLLAPGFEKMGMLPVTKSFSHLAQQALVCGFGGWLAWKYLLLALLALHIVNSYVYLGEHPVWNFIAFTTRNLLRPLAWLPLRAGRMDFAPVLAVALVWLLAAWLGGEFWLRSFFEDRLHATLWSLPRIFQSLPL